MEMLKLEKQNLAGVKLPTNLQLQKWLKMTLEILGKNDLAGRLELNYVDREAIRKINKDFRHQDKVTDVLSFSFMGENRFPKDDLVGQIFLEPLTAKKQAVEHGVDWKDEIEFLFVHALLHVFGYDHEKEFDFKEMYGLQARIMPGPRWETFVNQIYRESFGEREV